MSAFENLGISKPILSALKDLGFEEPSEIQTKAIPYLLENDEDLVGLAQTGTGKTAAFGIPLLQKINTKSNKTQALVLSPTRELGQQITEQLDLYGKNLKGLKTLAVYGGASIERQLRGLKKGAQIVVATPGRLLDLLNRKAANLKNIDYLVLDEADEMLNMGFKEDIDKILRYTNTEKNTWLFSATMPDDIRKIISEYMAEDALEVRVNPKAITNENIEHQFISIKGRDKTDHFFQYLEAHEEIRAIVFCRTKAGTSKLAEKLLKEKFDAGALHGDMSQGQRDRVMKRFKDHDLSILCATDVAARGIDVNDLSHVIHYNIPENPEYYTHRAGRTARAGKKGISISFVTGSDMRRLKYIQQKVKIKFQETALPKGEDLALRKVNRWAQKLNEIRIPRKFDQKLLDEAETHLADLDRKDILEKLVYKEVESLLTSGKRGASNDERSKKGLGGNKNKDDRSKKGKDRQKRIEDSGSVRFFMNAGKMDGLDKKDLTDFIVEMAHLSKREVSNIRLLKTSSYFEVPEKYAKKLPNYFRGIEIDGRALRVNRDQDPNEKNKKSEFGKPKKSSARKRGKSSKPNKRRR